MSSPPPKNWSVPEVLKVLASVRDAKPEELKGLVAKQDADFWRCIIVTYLQTFLPFFPDNKPSNDRLVMQHWGDHRGYSIDKVHHDNLENITNTQHDEIMNTLLTNLSPKPKPAPKKFHILGIAEDLIAQICSFGYNADRYRFGQTCRQVYHSSQTPIAKNWISIDEEMFRQALSRNTGCVTPSVISGFANIVLADGITRAYSQKNEEPLIQSLFKRVQGLVIQGHSWKMNWGEDSNPQKAVPIVLSNPKVIKCLKEKNLKRLIIKGMGRISEENLANMQDFLKSVTLSYFSCSYIMLCAQAGKIFQQNGATLKNLTLDCRRCEWDEDHILKQLPQFRQLEFLDLILSCPPLTFEDNLKVDRANSPQLYQFSEVKLDVVGYFENKQWPLLKKLCVYLKSLSFQLDSWRINFGALTSSRPSVLAQERESIQELFNFFKKQRNLELDLSWFFWNHCLTRNSELEGVWRICVGNIPIDVSSESLLQNNRLDCLS